MRNLYRVTFDIRFGRTWAGNANGWATTNVLANGDARVAADMVERAQLRTEYGDERKRPNRVRILEVTRVATDVLA